MASIILASHRHTVKGKEAPYEGRMKVSYECGDVQSNLVKQIQMAALSNSHCHNCVAAIPHDLYGYRGSNV